MQLVYFAKVRETIGHASETIALPNTVQCIGDMIDWLSQKSPEYAAAFVDHSKLRFALDQVMATTETAITGAKELAIFPPVTGG
jgi:sulfur-carrier protein